MKINIPVTLTDSERRMLYRRLTGKANAKALATRAMVREAVLAFVDGVLSEPEATTTPAVTAQCSAASRQPCDGERRLIQKLIADGRSREYAVSYARGAYQVINWKKR